MGLWVWRRGIAVHGEPIANGGWNSFREVPVQVDGGKVLTGRSGEGGEMGTDWQYVLIWGVGRDFWCSQRFQNFYMSEAIKALGPKKKMDQREGKTD